VCLGVPHKELPETYDHMSRIIMLGGDTVYSGLLDWHESVHQRAIGADTMY